MAGVKAKHSVHGVWMTMEEAARRLGFKRITLEKWRSLHRHADGSRALLEEAWDHYQDVRRGLYNNHPGRPPEKYWVQGKRVTIKKAAEALGVKEGTLWTYKKKHECSLDAACQFYRKRNEMKAKRDAEREILRIINGE